MRPFSPDRQSRQPPRTQDSTSSLRPDRHKLCSSRGNTSCRTMRANTSDGGGNGVTTNATSVERKCTDSSLSAGSAISGHAPGASAIACRHKVVLSCGGRGQAQCRQALCLGVSSVVLGNIGRASWTGHVEMLEVERPSLRMDRISAMMERIPFPWVPTTLPAQLIEEERSSQ